jgi:3-deoxy-D-manno-octulosonic-acid transferase
MHSVQLLLYNLFIRFYALAVFAASFFNSKAKLWLAGRKNWECQAAKLTSLKGKRIWFHCASLGEFEQARPVIEKYSCDNSDNSIILTFFSPSGYEVRKNYECADAVLYLPLDTPTNAKAVIEAVKPDVVLFVKYEFWYHYLSELKQRNIPVILFSSVFRKKQIFFWWYGCLFREMLKFFSKIFVQDAASKNLLSSIGVSSEIHFDTRFDRVKQIAETPKSFPALEKFKQGSKIFMSGSTWLRDEELIVRCINEDVLKEFKYVIAPHYINRERIAAMRKQIRGRSTLLSELTESNASETDVVVVDSIGSLAFLYRYAEIAYVGGGFDTSVHNLLEPAVYGLPVIFGTKFQKSVEAKELLEKKAAFSVSTYAELRSALASLSDINSPLFKTVSETAKNYVAERSGGSERVVEEIKNYR